MTGLELVRDEGLKLGIAIPDKVAEYILWEHTGFPSFFAPASGKTIEDECRRQVRAHLDENLAELRQAYPTGTRTAYDRLKEDDVF